MCQVIAITNQKGGVGKTTTTFHLGTKLAQECKRVLLIDADPQASLTASFGIRDADTLDTTLTNALQAIRSPLVMSCAIPRPWAQTCLATSSVWTTPLRHFPHSWKPAGSSWKMCGYRWRTPRQKSKSPSPERKSCKARPRDWTN